jgi:hypothetical protein
MVTYPETTPWMWMNMPKSSFADAFALLTYADTEKPFNLFVQENQSVTARRRVIAIETPHRPGQQPKRFKNKLRKCVHA